MMEIRPDRVAIYIRWSTDDQGEGTTLEVQLEGCRHYALSQGWQCREDLVFIDDGYSGGSLDRPALTRLREMIGQGQVDCVVVFKIDRLSRNVVDTVNLVLREWGDRCHVKSAREAIDTTTQQGKMFFYTLVSFAEWERSVIKERTWSGRMKRLQEGRNPGFRPPFGLRTGETPGSFAEVPEEATVVRRIFALYGQGLGYKRIAAQLAAEGLRFRGGRPFTAQAVTAILTNPIYTGKLVYGRVQRGRQGSGAAPTVVESPHLPRLIAPEQFRQAQALRTRRAEREAPNRAAASDHLLTGIIRCKRCSSALMGRKKYAAAGREHVQQPPYYICVGQRNKGKQFCDAGYIRQEYIDDWVVARLVERYGEAAGADQFRSDSTAELEQQAAATAEHLAVARRALAGLERELAVIGRDYRQERITVDEYREQRTAVEKERARLTAEAEALAKSLEALGERRALQQSRLDSVSRVQRWEQLGQAERKHLLRELIAHLAVYRDPTAQQVEFELAWVSAASDVNKKNPPA